MSKTLEFIKDDTQLICAYNPDGGTEPILEKSKTSDVVVIKKIFDVKKSDLITKDEFMMSFSIAQHRSKPHNPNIANGFFRAGLVETWGRGIEKICDACKEHGIGIPEYTLYPEDIMILFQAKQAIKTSDKNKRLKQAIKTSD